MMKQLLSIQFLKLAIASLGFLTGCATKMPLPPTQVVRGDFTVVQRYATTLSEEAIAQKWVQGISIALIDDQRVVWSSGFGYADVDAKQVASADTLYRVGSISKLFTDAAAMQLVEGGKLQLDGAVQTVLPGFSPRLWAGSSTGNITTRMLMTHHSGLPRDVHKAFQSPQPPRFTEEAGNFSGHLTYRPGQLHSYSNIGLSVLGSMVENASGMPFEDYMQSAVLKPLGMSHSAFDVAASQDASMAKGYQGSMVIPAVPMRDIPAGGLNSSANDLGKFLMMVFAQGQANGQRILTPESVAEMLRPQNQNVPLDFDNRMGLGWFMQSADTARIKGGGWNVGHDGAIDGYRSTLMALPEHKLGVVVLSNSSSASGLVRIIAAQTLKVALEVKTGIRQPDTDGAAKPAFVDQPLAAEQVARWAGTYSTRMGPVRIFTADNKTLRVETTGLSADLLEREDGSFGLQYKLLGVLPATLGSLGEAGFSRRSMDGRELLVMREYGRDALFGEKLPPTALNTEQRQFVEAFSGNYEVVNTGADKVEFSGVRVFEEHGVLMAEVRVANRPQTRRVVLRPISSTQSLILESLADSGDMVQGLKRDDTHVELQALGLRFRKINPTKS